MTNAVRAAGAAPIGRNERPLRDRRPVNREYDPHGAAKRNRNDEGADKNQREIVVPKKKKQDRKSTNSAPSNRANNAASTGKKRGRPSKKAAVPNSVVNEEEIEDENRVNAVNDEIRAEQQEPDNVVEPPQMQMTPAAFRQRGQTGSNGGERDDRLAMLEEEIAGRDDIVGGQGVAGMAEDFHGQEPVRMAGLVKFEPQQAVVATAGSVPVQSFRNPKVEAADHRQVKQERNEIYMRQLMYCQSVDEQKPNDVLMQFYQQENHFGNVTVKQEVLPEEPQRVMMRPERDVAEICDPSHPYAGFPVNVASWKSEDVSRWFGMILDENENLKKVQARTIKEGINGQVLLMLLNKDIRDQVVADLGFPVGPLLIIEQSLQDMFSY